MSRALFLFLFHMSAAAAATLAAFGFVSWSGWSGPVGLLVGLAAFFAVAPVNALAVRAYERWFG